MSNLTTFVLCIALVVMIIRDKRKEKDYEDINEWTYDKQEKTFVQTPKNVVSKNGSTYYAKPILTPNELQAYRKLKILTDQQNYIICPKIRLADLIHPYNNNPDYMKHFSKIKAKHVDFTICDQKLNVIGIIELDDSSHDRKDRIERDRFVDKALKEANYKIIHVREITPDILDKLIRQ